MVPGPSQELSVLLTDILNAAPWFWTKGQNPPAWQQWPGSSTGAGATPRAAKQGRLLSRAPFLPIPKAPWWRRQQPRSPGEEIQVIKIHRNWASWSVCSPPVPIPDWTSVLALGMGCGKG